MFMLLYDMETVEEEAFVKWKENVNDDYPGKGRALFQVRISFCILVSIHPYHHLSPPTGTAPPPPLSTLIVVS
jgi:hypothetical protein